MTTTNWKYSLDGLTAYRTFDNGGCESRMVHAIDADELSAALPADIIVQSYLELRAVEYPSIQVQLDMQYHDTINNTTTWQDTITEIKSKYPKV